MNLEEDYVTSKLHEVEQALKDVPGGIHYGFDSDDERKKFIDVLSSYNTMSYEDIIADHDLVKRILNQYASDYNVSTGWLQLVKSDNPLLPFSILCTFPDKIKTYTFELEVNNDE